MKKGFTMIELIFVIVILGILASVAIPRLAGTREDAEISAAVANLRTLVSDANVYYVTKGTLTGATWSGITSVALKKTNGDAMDATTGAVGTTATANLKVGDANDCIGFHIVDKTDNVPAHIKFTKKTGTGGTGTAEGVCGKVLASKPVEAYLNSVVKSANGTADVSNAIPIGSTAKIY